jgi:N6-adenosine-specific RNA methylase IME4
MSKVVKGSIIQINNKIKIKMITAATEERSQELISAYDQINLKLKNASAKLEIINLVS